MSKATDSQNDDLRSDYDFSQGMRGKYQHFAGQPHTIKIHHPDGSVTTREVESSENVVRLDDDVRKYFPDSEAVNKALRGLIDLIPKDDQAA